MMLNFIDRVCEVIETSLTIVGAAIVLALCIIFLC